MRLDQKNTAHYQSEPYAMSNTLLNDKNIHYAPNSRTWTPLLDITICKNEGSFEISMPIKFFLGVA